MRSQNLLLIFTFLGIAVTCSRAQLPFLGKCPDRQVVQNFDVSSYLGKWYEIEKYFAIFELGGTCVEANYSLLSNGSVGVRNTQVQQKTGEIRTIEGTARQTVTDGSAKLGVTFPTVPLAGEAPYWVLDTDYTNYSIVWSCNDLAILNFQIVWFLARDRNPSAEIRQKVHDKMAEVGIRRELLMTTNQTNCGTP